MTGPMKDVVNIGGREFEFVVRNTIDRELYWTWLLNETGLTSFQQYPGETFEQFFVRAMARMADTRLGPELISTQIVPRGWQWTREVAKDTAALIRSSRSQMEDDDIDLVFVRLFQELAACRALKTLPGQGPDSVGEA